MKLNNETKIGIMVSFVIFVLAVITMKAGDFNFSQRGYLAKVQFTNIDGVNLSAPVLLNGFEVGHVKDIKIIYGDKTTKMELTLWLGEQAKLTTDTKVYIKSLGLLGEKYIALISRSKAEPLAKNTIMTGVEPPDLDKLLTDGQELAVELKEVTSNLNERLKVNQESIDEIIANMNVTMGNLASISENVDEHLEINEQNIDEIIANLQSTSVNLEELSHDLKLNPWKLLHRSKEKKKK